MTPSSPSATARTAAASVTIENTTSEAAATARGDRAQRMPDLISGCGLVLAAVEAGDRVPGRDEPRHDARPHGAEPDKPDVHSCLAVKRET